MELWTWIVIAVVVLFVGRTLLLSYRSPAQLQQIAQALKKGAFLVDVRTAAEYQSSHLRHALNIPVDSLTQGFTRLGSKRKPVVLYCQSGSRSARAASVLRQLGFEQVLDLGPMRNGSRAGLT